MLPRELPSPVTSPKFEDERPIAWFQAQLNLQCPLLEALPFPAGVSFLKSADQHKHSHLA